MPQQQEIHEESTRNKKGKGPHFEEVRVPDVSETIKKAEKAEKAPPPKKEHGGCGCW